MVWPALASVLSEDDLNLREMNDEGLHRAWDLWFELAQATNEWDPPYEHGVFVGIEKKSLSTLGAEAAGRRAGNGREAGVVHAPGSKKKMSNQRSDADESGAKGDNAAKTRRQE
jgi:hypothetical protein